MTQRTALHIAVWLDPLEALKPAKDSTIAILREAARRGHRVFAVEPDGLFVEGGRVCASGVEITLQAGDAPWFIAGERARRALNEFDAVLVRKDPPFDIEYVTATWLLQQAECEGARVLNAPQSLRDYSEKLSTLAFPQFTVPCVVAREAALLGEFIEREGDVILKPLDGMGGASIFRVRADDPNRNVIIETLSQHGSRSVMAQRYIPEITKGDKRILIIDGEPVPFALARIPRAGETRGNLAAGGTGVAQPLSERDREIAMAVGAALSPRGLFLIGIDVIGDWLTEINVTSPTCFVEITAQSGFDVAARFVDALVQRCMPPR